MTWKIPLAVSTFEESHIEEAVNVLRSGDLTMGAHCLAFEHNFASYIGRKHAIFVNSGSSANLLAIFLLANPDFKPQYLSAKWTQCQRGGQKPEIIVPALTWATTVWPIVQAGAIPVFVDCDPTTLQMDLNQVRDAITDNTMAVFAVQVMGNSPNMDALTMLCTRHGIHLVEDACEALGTRYAGAKIGTFGDMATFSFYFSHHMTTIEGGMVVTDDDHIADLLRAMRSHGWTRHMTNAKEYSDAYPDVDPKYMFATTGFNLRPTEINGVLGRGQLECLDNMNARRNEIVNELIEMVPFCYPTLLPMALTENCEPAWFGLPMLAGSKSQRDSLTTYLERHRIQTRPIICGNITRHPAMQKIKHVVSDGGLVGADRTMDHGLYIGVHPKMTAGDVSYVAEMLSSWIRS